MLLALACTPTPGVQVAGGPVVTSETLDSATRRVGGDLRDANRRNELDRANVTALEVDSIVVHPDSLVLAVGDTIPLFGGPVSWEARGRSGVVSGFAPWFRIDNRSIASISGDRLVALRTGSGALLLIAAVQNDSQPPRIRHVTRLPLRIH